MNIAYIAMQIASAVAKCNVVFLADDEQQAAALASAVSALLPCGNAVLLPSSDALPGDAAPASPSNIGNRIAALRKLRRWDKETQRRPIALILSGEAAARCYPSPEALDPAPPILRSGDPLSPEAFGTLLEDLGYFTDDRVDEPGEMALRGDVVDIFPADAGQPARIEIADGTIGAIRYFDALSQRTEGELDMLELGRANEPAIEHPVSILAHLKVGMIGLSEKADRNRRRFIKLAEDAAGGRAVDAIEDVAWANAVKHWKPLSHTGAIEEVPRFVETKTPLAALTRFARPLIEEGRALILAGSVRDLRFLRPKVAKRMAMEVEPREDYAALRALAPRQAATIAMPVDAGFVDDRFLVIAAADILGSRAILDDAARPDAALWTLTSADIRCGDIVIHEDHGIGKVVGLEPAPEAIDGGTEMIALEYAAGARRLVSIDDAGRIWRYGADADAVTLEKLDGSSWVRRRRSIEAAVAHSAETLAALATARRTLKAVVIDPDPAAYERFANSFPFNETADQARAINAVRDDLSSGKPMDRLIVGDVGYGKTEVALRAAALAALAGYQVVMAAPTTVLVRQHIETFQRRFADSGIRVAGLSRLSSAAEKKAVKAGLADGSIQIVIGTGAVMGKSVSYNQLGLVIIDEEQRFGAADKARLRGSGEVHLLTLSATPIPRTLQMALVGLQQLSFIATPPARRQPIRTSLDHFDDSRIRTALQREKARGGQSFVVVPRIEDMENLAERLNRVVPDLRIVQAHGKMPPAEIDEVMVGFAGGKGDILLATNIIEAGLDVPRANTMIIWRADRFGLSQLHQFRGRVGRGNRRGQVILLTDIAQAIGEQTLKRLRTLATFDHLGAGFDISAQDLDMRGAGDLSGETQSGHMKLIGADLYQHLLGLAIRQARGEQINNWTPELNLSSAGTLPEGWIPETDVRLALYMRLARLETTADIDAFEEELADRFGPLPVEAELLLARARICRVAKVLNVERIDAGPAAIALTPRSGFDSDTEQAGLTEKDGRFLLKQDGNEALQSERVQALLEALSA